MSFNILAIIPARGGSKGIKKKNLKKINGMSLVNRAVVSAQKSNFISDIFVSTDCDDTISEVEKMGVIVPFKRPGELSGDRIGDIDVLYHGVIEYEKHYQKAIDYIVMLQPTSPLRTSEMIDQCTEILINERVDAVWTVSKVDLKYHPLKQLVINSDTKLGSLFDETGSNIIARQQLSDTYARNGACYVFSRDCIVNQKTIYGRKLRLFELKDPQVSIDDLNDLELAERLLIEKRE